MWINSDLARRIFITFDIRTLIENVSREIKFHESLTRIKETLHEDLYIYIYMYIYIYILKIISR